MNKQFMSCLDLPVPKLTLITFERYKIAHLKLHSLDPN